MLLNPDRIMMNYTMTDLVSTCSLDSGIGMLKRHYSVACSVPPPVHTDCMHDMYALGSNGCTALLCVQTWAIRFSYAIAQIVPVSSNVSWSNVNIIAVYCTQYKALFGSVDLKKEMMMKPMMMTGQLADLLKKGLSGVDVIRLRIYIEP